MSKKKIAFFSFIILLIILASILSMVFATNENNTNLNNEKIDAEIKYLDEKFSNIYKELLIDGLRVDWNKMQEPIKEIFTYSVSVEELRLSAKNVLWLNLATRKAEDVLLCIKWLVYQVKNHVPCADINAELLKLSEERLQDLAQ